MKINPTQLSALSTPNSLGNAQMSELERLAGQGEDAKAAKEFESLFASMLVKEMRESVEGGFFGEGPGADTYGQWFDKEMGNAIASDGGLGLAAVLKVQLGLERQAKLNPENQTEVQK